MSDVTADIDPVQPEGRNVVRIVIVAAVAAALAVGVWFLVVAPLVLGGDEPVAVDTTPIATSDQATTGAADTSEVDEALEALEALPVVTYEVFLERDPFEPVVPRPEAESATSDDPVAPIAPTPVADDGTNGEDGAPGTEGGDAPNPGETPATPPSGEEQEDPATCRSGQEVVCDGRIVSVVEVSEDGSLAIVQVDSTLYEVRAGEVFAGSFRVESIRSDRVTILHGDDAFELRVGDRVLK